MQNVFHNIYVVNTSSMCHITCMVLYMALRVEGLIDCGCSIFVIKVRNYPVPQQFRDLCSMQRCSKWHLLSHSRWRRLPILGIINPVNFPSEFFSCVNDASDLFAIMPILLCAWYSRETSLTIFFNFSPHPVQDFREPEFASSFKNLRQIPILYEFLLLLYAHTFLL